MSRTIGFRFRPNDQEIINHYLINKMDGHDFSYVIREIDLCRHEPWDLPEISVVKDDEVWYFFCRPEYKYRSSKRANRATETGFWKPTGKVRFIKGTGGLDIGTKRTLVFHLKEQSSVSVRTPWVIHEYQVKSVLRGQTEFVFCKLKNKADERTNDSALAGAEGTTQVDRHAEFYPPSATIALDGMIQIQESLLDDSEFHLNNLSAVESAGLTSQDIGDNWLKVQRILFDDSEDEVDPSFADSFLTEPEEHVRQCPLLSSNYQLQGTQYQFFVEDASDTETDVIRSREYLEQVGSSRSNDGHKTAGQFSQVRSIEAIRETLLAPGDEMDRSRLEILDTETRSINCLTSLPELESHNIHRRRQAAFPTTKSTDRSEKYMRRVYVDSDSSRKSSGPTRVVQADFRTTKSTDRSENYKRREYVDSDSSRNTSEPTDEKKVLQDPASASAGETKTSSFVHMTKVPSSHRPSPGLGYLINVIVGLILLVVFIEVELSFRVG